MVLVVFCQSSHQAFVKRTLPFVTSQLQVSVYLCYDWHKWFYFDSDGFLNTYCLNASSRYRVDKTQQMLSLERQVPDWHFQCHDVKQM